ncbi:34908_t:CDS:1, partial [Racocetra persica]
KDFWAKMIKNIKEIMPKLNENKLSPEDEKRVMNIAKSHLLSKIWYPAYLLPPDTNTITELSDLITKWIKDKSPPRSNGIELPKIQDMVDARLGLIWLKLLSSNDLWAKIEREFIEEELKEHNVSIETALKNPVKLNIWPLEWRPYVTAWKRLNGRIPISTNSWPWDQKLIEIANLKGNEYSVMEAIEYLRNIQDFSTRDA